VNPLQFGPTEDLATYPRDLDHDRAMAETAGADLVVVPSLEEMYPQPVRTMVSVERVSHGMEGASRPTHFDGVATVVAKLFAIAAPCRAYFGEKDFQQLAVVRTMARDLSFPVEVIGCPTVREADGLAMSSRNAYLSADEREAAPVLHWALQAGRAAIAAGETDAAAVRAAMVAVVAAEPLARLDYLEVADPDTLLPVDEVRGTVRLFGAIRLGRARLIDNVGATAAP
jgi:pantoate--beta-alanine ligase